MVVQFNFLHYNTISNSKDSIKNSPTINMFLVSDNKSINFTAKSFIIHQSIEITALNSQCRIV